MRFFSVFPAVSVCGFIATPAFPAALQRIASVDRLGVLCLGGNSENERKREREGKRQKRESEQETAITIYIDISFSLLLVSQIEISDCSRF